MSDQNPFDYDVFSDAMSTISGKGASLSPPKPSYTVFTGRRDWFRLPGFLTTMELQPRARPDLNDAQKVAFFCKYLDGPAAKWALNWFQQATEDSSYYSFVTGFRAHFLKKVDPHKILNLLGTISEAKSGIENYNDDFNTLWEMMQNGFWTEMAALSTYLRGLKPDTRRFVYPFPSKHCSDCYTCCLCYNYVRSVRSSCCYSFS